MPKQEYKCGKCGKATTLRLVFKDEVPLELACLKCDGSMTLVRYPVPFVMR